uniref:Nuclear pore complex protein Nup85 n=1 Tax=Glossina austeni TaxID=7395 RepID=A0A1A9V1P7_GLOAU
MIESRENIVSWKPIPKYEQVEELNDIFTKVDERRGVLCDFIGIILMYSFIVRNMKCPGRSAEEEICKVQAKKSSTEERYGNALELAIRSKDTFYVTSIADYLLKIGDILCPDVIGNTGTRMFISPRLVFLAKYFDFCQILQKERFP